ncbi:MAG: hypothetical protein GXP32_04755 [Kiritimatiellaeota bacterium]|nr:hypothetical protein [Kiritimatiellota bacterium]
MQILRNKCCRILAEFALVVVCAYVVRDLVYRRDVSAIANEYKAAFGKDIGFIPFQVESAMMYSYAEEVARTCGIKERDDSLVGMEDVSVFRQFTVGLEYFLGYGYLLKHILFPPDLTTIAPTNYEITPDFARWIRVQLRWWISLISGFVFLWLVALRIPAGTALTGGLLHAVSFAAIARYTGQDIVRGNFALPLIAAAFAAAAWYLGAPSRKKLVIVGTASFLALASWDLTRLCFALWGVAEIARVSSGGMVNAKRRYLWLTLWVSAILAAVLIPYHREHALILSPFSLVVFPLVAVSHYFAAGKTAAKRFAIVAAVALSLICVWWIASTIWGTPGNYSHFVELIKAKIRFLNVKPENPALLSFEARSVWMPGMHSATKFITDATFPMVLHATFIAMVLTMSIGVMRKSFRRLLPIANLPLFCALFFSLGFFFIVRYHVLAILFLATLIPIFLHLWLKNAWRLTLRTVLKSIGAIIIYFTLYNIYFAGSFTAPVIGRSFLYPILGFAAAATGIMFGGFVYRLAAKKRPGLAQYAKGLICFFVFLVFIFELDGAFKGRRYESHFFPETAALVKWLRVKNLDAPVMADFELSPLLKTYCRAKIVVQPKFELKQTRKTYERFINLMFRGDEGSFADFCLEKKAGYFVFDKGYASSRGNLSPLYMAGLRELVEDSPVCMMASAHNRKKLKRFREIKPPKDLRILSNRYVVFKVLPPND